MGAAIPASILSALEGGVTVLTAGERAARALRRAFSEAKKSRGETCWQSPPVFTLETWLAALWHRRLIAGEESRLLLNRDQEHALWRSIIAADRDLSGFNSADSLAALAAQAFHLLCRHNGRNRLGDFAASTDTRAFARWAAEFDRLCTRNSFLSTAQLPSTLSFRGAAEESDSASLLLVDFDLQQPAVSSLLANFSVADFRTAVPVSSASAFPAPDKPSELRAAARWAASLLAANPSASIAIVVPNLADRRSQIDRVFHQFLSPAQYEFSLGRPLAETALVATALDLLRWPLEPLPLDSVSQLLLSPFFGGASPEQALAAAEFDAHELRRATLLRPELSLNRMIDLVANSRHRAQPLTELRKSLYRIRRAAEELQSSQRQSHAAWSDAFRNLLEAAGWSALASADSLTFQTFRSWESALDSLATLDFSGEFVTASAALGTLTRIARETTFASESSNAPIQILGPLEAGAIAFDALWFLSADDLTWPATSATNPLLPFALQRELGLRGADPERDNALAVRITDRLAHSAPQTVFSYAQRDEDGHRRPSPLLRALNLTPLPEATVAAATVAAAPAMPLESFPDSAPPPLAQATPLRGGARVLELQAACAFRAFAEIRLHATEPEPSDPGLDPRDRGTQVHKIMQAFWTQVQSQQALKAIPPEGRKALLDACIAANLGDAATEWERAYLEVQRKRLHALLNPWLDFELARPAFSVRQQEERELVQIGPLSLEVRADRIDETAAGLLILDYKTGNATPAQWLGDRPDAPQLPLYAVLAAGKQEPVAGAAFALLRAGDDLALKGYADCAEPPAKPFAEQIEDWHRVLTALAESFAHAEPTPDPKLYPQTCKRCGQRSFCRLDIAAFKTAEDEEMEPADV
jgi:probable DNA repair protein